MKPKDIFIFVIRFIFLVFVLVSLGWTHLDKQEVFAGNYSYVYRIHINGDVVGYLKDDALIKAYYDKRIVDLNELYPNVSIIEPENILYDLTIEEVDEFLSGDEIYQMLDKYAIFQATGFELLIDNHIALVASSKYLLESSLEDMLELFAGKEDYENLINGVVYDKTQYGNYLENAHIQNKIEIRETIVPIEELYIESKDIKELLLFGKKSNFNYYEVEPQDTIESIAFKNELSIGEFLIANPHLFYNEESKEQSLLVSGEEVKVDLVSPLIDVIVERHVIIEESKPFTTEFRQVDDLTTGYSRTVQTGVEGAYRSEYAVTSLNGNTTKSIRVSQDTLYEPINEVIEEGINNSPVIGNINRWLWPTKGTWITSPFGYRGGSFHAALDIAGAVYNSPIYAANNGYVQDIYYDQLGGWQVLINHGNGWYTVYAHLASNPSAYVSEGEIISAGKIIGGMGATGTVSGIHLHFEVWQGGAPYQGGVRINPINLNYYH